MIDRSGIPVGAETAEGLREGAACTAPIGVVLLLGATVGADMPDRLIRATLTDRRVSDRWSPSLPARDTMDLGKQPSAVAELAFGEIPDAEAELADLAAGAAGTSRRKSRRMKLPPTARSADRER